MSESGMKVIRAEVLKSRVCITVTGRAVKTQIPGPYSSTLIEFPLCNEAQEFAILTSSQVMMLALGPGTLCQE